MKAIKKNTIYDDGKYKIIQEHDYGSGGTWGVFVVKIGFDKHYFTHANQAVRTLCNLTGLDPYRVIKKMTNRWDYVIVDPYDYANNLEYWNKQLKA